MTGQQRDLTTTEGVEEGSARSTVEAGPDGAGPVASDPGSDGSTPGVPREGFTPDEQDAAPLDMESRESRAARAEHGTGQQLSVGEGSAP